MSVKTSAESARWFLSWIGAGILFPLFFQIGAGIYNSPVALTDSLGDLHTVPIPVSAVVCLAALFFFRGRWKEAGTGLAMVATVIAVSLVSLFLGGDGALPAQRKALLAAQVLLPLAGLLLGQLVDDGRKTIARSFLAVISVVVPFQLLATWHQGSLILTHNLYAFSIYSHLQYVTLIFVCAYAYALASLWEEQKVWLCALMPLMLVYVIAGVSFLTIAAFTLMLAAVFAQICHTHRHNWKRLFILALLLSAGIAVAATYFCKMYGKEVPAGVDPQFFSSKFKRLLEGKIPVNLTERLADWQLFEHGIVESTKTALVGHPQPMPREVRSSPHNWYLDIAYTFGLLGLLPAATLIGYTAVLCWRRRKALDRRAWCLVALVFYLVVIDNSFKVTLRQPYPGVFAYFLWGLLLSRLGAWTMCCPNFNGRSIGAGTPAGTSDFAGARSPQQSDLDTGALHVSASLVLYKNEFATLGKTLLALQAAGRLAKKHYRALYLSVTLIDNSEDAVFHANLLAWARQLEAQLPDWALHLVRSQGNLGYGRGNNLVIREVGSQYHIVINPDLFVQDSALLEALHFMENHEKVGLLTPAVFGEDGQRHYLCKRNPTLGTMFLRSFSPRWLQARFKHLNDEFEMRDFDYEKFIPQVEYPTGCFMFFRTEALQEIGGFDPDFFLHYEDADIGRRMLAIAPVVYVPSVRVVHRWARDTHRSLAARLVTVRSGLLYWWKWGGIFRSGPAAVPLTSWRVDGRQRSFTPRSG